MFFGLLTTANYKVYRHNYRKNSIDSEWVEERAKNTNSELSILLTARNDFIKKDSNNIDIKRTVPASIISSNI
jgi:hypothetical protein